MSQFLLTQDLRHLPPRLIFDVRQRNARYALHKRRACAYRLRRISRAWNLLSAMPEFYSVVHCNQQRRRGKAPNEGTVCYRRSSRKDRMQHGLREDLGHPSSRPPQRRCSSALPILRSFTFYRSDEAMHTLRLGLA